jgi:hypothetical protein
MLLAGTAHQTKKNENAGILVNEDARVRSHAEQIRLLGRLLIRRRARSCFRPRLPTVWSQRPGLEPGLLLTSDGCKPSGGGSVHSERSYH